VQTRTHTYGHTRTRCYVDTETCDATRAAAYGISIFKSWTNANLYYSYDMCPDPYSKPSNYVYKPDLSYSQMNMSQCPYVTTAPGCECTGNNANLGPNETALHGVQP